MSTLAALLRNLPKPDAPIDELADATTALAQALADDAGVPVDGRIRRMASQRISSPDTPPYPLTFGWSRAWSTFDDQPGYERLWADDDRLADETSRLNHEITARKRAEADARQRETEQRDQERRDAELADVTARLKRQYLQTPGGTEATFAAALPELLEAHRRDLIARSATADEEALRLYRQRVKF